MWNYWIHFHFINSTVEQWTIIMMRLWHGYTFRSTSPLWGETISQPLTEDKHAELIRNNLLNKQSSYRSFLTPWWSCDGVVWCVFFIIYTGDRPAKRIWIGLYRNTQWVWKFSGEIATFVDWDSGQPNENTGEIYGVYLVDTQKVHDFTDRERAYMCEIWIK